LKAFEIDPCLIIMINGIPFVINMAYIAIFDDEA
jgi:hypothetical protein